jgi:hypothetical protein
MGKIKIIPAKPGAQVYDPEKCDFLPDSGREVEKTIYWIRRMRDGDVRELATINKPEVRRRKRASQTDTQEI